MKTVNKPVSSKIRRFCINLLKNTGCDLDCYAGDDFKAAVDSLVDYYSDKPVEENALEWSIPALACELISIGNEYETKQKSGKYKIIWDTEDTTDGCDADDNLRDAKVAVKEIFMAWMEQFNADSTCNSPDDWDRMIYEFNASVYRTADLKENQDLDEVWSWSPSSAELTEIGWCLVAEMSDELYDAHKSMHGWPDRK